MGLFDLLKKMFVRGASVPATSVEDDLDDAAPGWDAIDGVLKPLYPGQEPKHWGTVVSWILGGPDPLDGVSAYRSNGPPSHWHYVSYGMTDLYAKDSEDPAFSGWGFEFTFRLKREPGEDAAPIWAVNLLQNLGRYVFSSGSTFDHGHYIDCNGPIAKDEETELVALLFLRDPQLPPIDSPHGSVQFLQVIGLTADEHEACRMWNSESFAEVLRRSNPLLVTDLGRRSVLGDAAVADEVREGQVRDGSSSSALHVDSLSWKAEGDRFIIAMTAAGFVTLASYLRGRLDHGLDFAVIGKEQVIAFKPGEKSAVSENDACLTITLAPETTRSLTSQIAPVRGTYDVEGLNVTFEVSPTLIRNDQDEVVQVVG